jgi:peptidase C39-like protein
VAAAVLLWLAGSGVALADNCQGFGDCFEGQKAAAAAAAGAVAAAALALQVTIKGFAVEDPSDPAAPGPWPGATRSGEGGISGADLFASPFAGRGGPLLNGVGSSPPGLVELEPAAEAAPDDPFDPLLNDGDEDEEELEADDDTPKDSGQPVQQPGGGTTGPDKPDPVKGRKDQRTKVEAAEDAARSADADARKSEEAFRQVDQEVQKWRDDHKPANPDDPEPPLPGDLLEKGQKAQTAAADARRKANELRDQAAKQRGELDPAYSQFNNTTCGLASARMVIESTTGQKVAETDLQQESQQFGGAWGPNGAKADNVSKILEKHGVANTVDENVSLSDVKTMAANGPVIVKVMIPGAPKDTPHGIVIDRVTTANGTTIIQGRDPAPSRGRFSLTEEQFKQDYKLPNGTFEFAIKTRP